MRIAYPLALIFLASASFAQAPTTAPGSRNPAAVTGGTYTVDPGHTLVVWTLDHLGFSPYSGIFGDVTGTLTLDPKKLARYDGTWLGALEETESALARYSSEMERVATLRRARTNSMEAARVARIRYRAGRENFQIVLEAERSLSQVEAALAQSEAQLSTNLVSVFLALGGGWQVAERQAQR